SQPEPKVSTTVQKTRPGPTQPHNKEGQANQNKTNPKNHTQPKSCAAPRAMA
ncbi:cell envelope biogenesis protein TolA, partial [Actinomyces oris]